MASQSQEVPTRHFGGPRLQASDEDVSEKSGSLGYRVSDGYDSPEEARHTFPPAGEGKYVSQGTGDTHGATKVGLAQASSKLLWAI